MVLCSCKLEHFLHQKRFITTLQGNHGEDVKECYYHLDNCPTHAYVRSLYKYPQQEFPYERLIEENSSRSLEKPEYEITDTGVC